MEPVVLLFVVLALVIAVAYRNTPAGQPPRRRPGRG